MGLASDCGRSGGHLAGHGRLSWEAPKRPFFFVLPPFCKGIELFFSAELGCLRLGIFRGTSNGNFGCETLLLSIISGLGGCFFYRKARLILFSIEKYALLIILRCTRHSRVHFFNYVVAARAGAAESGALFIAPGCPNTHYQKIKE